MLAPAIPVAGEGGGAASGSAGRFGAAGVQHDGFGSEFTAGLKKAWIRKVEPASCRFFADQRLEAAATFCCVSAIHL